MTAYARPIRGNYIIEGDLTSLINGYQFTGTDRDANIIHSTGYFLLWELKAIEDRYNYRTAHFVANNKIKIKRARLSTPGAVGLRAAVNRPSSIVSLSSCDDVPQSLGDPPIVLKFSRFNEWEDFDLTFMSDKAISAGMNGFYLEVSDLRLWIDDYNIQTAYVGETFGLILEMEIDTAGMVIDYDGGIV